MVFINDVSLNGIDVPILNQSLLVCAKIFVTIDMKFSREQTMFASKHKSTICRYTVSRNLNPANLWCRTTLIIVVPQITLLLIKVGVYIIHIALVLRKCRFSCL